MKEEQSISKVNQQEEVPTIGHHTIMTEEFIKVYHEALQFTNLEVHVELRHRNVAIYEKDHIHQVYTVDDPRLPHIVLLHGYGGTSLTFVRIFEHLKGHFQVHALDTFGVGLSSRGSWHDKITRQEAIEYYIGAIEQWRKKVGIQRFILAGHSFGGYIGTLYMERYAERVQQLILLSPAGTARFTDEYIKKRAENAKMFFCIAEKVYNMNIRPSKVMSNFFFGNKFIDRLLKNRLKLPENEQKVWKKYLQFISDQQDCSEKGFYLLFDWPLQPARSIETILTEIKPTIKIDFLYGAQDWMQPDGARRLASQFQNIHCHIIDDAGHQLIFDNPEMVSRTMVAVVKEGRRLQRSL